MLFSLFAASQSENLRESKSKMLFTHNSQSSVQLGSLVSSILPSQRSPQPEGEGTYVFGFVLYGLGIAGKFLSASPADVQTSCSGLKSINHAGIAAFGWRPRASLWAQCQEEFTPFSSCIHPSEHLLIPCSHMLWLTHTHLQDFLMRRATIQLDRSSCTIMSFTFDCIKKFTFYGVKTFYGLFYAFSPSSNVQNDAGNAMIFQNLL